MGPIARQDDNANQARRGVALQGFAPASAPGDELVDRVTEVVARIFGVPVALISLIDEDREHFKATFGSSPVDAARAFAFCELTMRLERSLVVPDARSDERFRDNPYVAGVNGIRFYAGAPIAGADGVPIGALCVIDRVAREADPAQVAVLEHLAELVMPLLELRLQTLRAIEVQNELSAVIDASPNAVVTRRRDGTIWGWNDAATRIFGYRRPDAELVAQALADALDESLAPEGEELYLRATVGVSVFPADAGEGSQLIALAHAAMRAAKARNERIGFHSGAQTHEGRRRLTLETSLRRALEHDEISVHYQPIVLLETGTTIAAEALLRWNNPQLGSISPEVFIPIAEETGTIVTLGGWVLREACRFGRRWLDAGGPGAVSVNVSARQFEGGDFERTVTDALAASGLPAGKLCLEITESMILRSPEAVFTAITRLRSLGVHCAIDDFGTGYSSLSRLMSFRIDALKIDRSFLREIGNPEASEACALVRALVNVGRSMGLSVIAEGVETQEQRAFLMASECESAQGYLYARPIPEDELLAR